MSNPDAIEAIVLSVSTNESKKNGKVRKVTFQIEHDTPHHPFEGMGGERIHIVCIRLNNDETPAQPEKPKRKFEELPAASQIAMCCGEPLFREYLRNSKSARISDDKDAADVWMKRYLGVASKTEVTPGTDAFAKWAEFYGSYTVWLQYEREQTGTAS